MTLREQDASRVVDVLCDAFFDYPVMRYVLGDIAGYSERLQTLIHFFVQNRFKKNELVLGIHGSNALDGVALVSYPGNPTRSAELDALREETWQTLGADARGRYETFGSATTHVESPGPHIHLNMIGVRSTAQGTGVGRLLLDAVHAHSVHQSDSAGVTLSTENPQNLSLYKHFGYTILGEGAVADAFTTWELYRAD